MWFGVYDVVQSYLRDCPERSWGNQWEFSLLPHLEINTGLAEAALCFGWQFKWLWIRSWILNTHMQLMALVDSLPRDEHDDAGSVLTNLGWFYPIFLGTITTFNYSYNHSVMWFVPNTCFSSARRTTSIWVSSCHNVNPFLGVRTRHLWLYQMTPAIQLALQHHILPPVVPLRPCAAPEAQCGGV